MSATLSISKSYPCLILTNNKGEIYFYKTLCCGIIPKLQATKAGEWLVYADEADLLNKAVFGMTAKEWREANPEQARTGNVRDFADILQLNVLVNLESLNTVMIEAGTSKERRFHNIRSWRSMKE